jgi:hypothetical protein
MSSKEKVYKCSSEHCPVCSMMAHYDSAVISSLGFELVEVETPEDFPELWEYILEEYPYEELVFPSYILLSKRKCVVGGAAKFHFKKMCEAAFLPEAILDGEPVPFVMERIITSLLVRLNQFGWELLSTSPLLFKTGEPLEPPSMLVTPSGEEVMLSTPNDVCSLFC